jgi:hypothetical protein
MSRAKEVHRLRGELVRLRQGRVYRRRIEHDEFLYSLADTGPSLLSSHQTSGESRHF